MDKPITNFFPGIIFNGKLQHLRGFCHHEDFSGVGVAVPDRLNLYRLQALRTVGGNSVRTSHNPYSTAIYDMADRLGLIVWDEARDYDKWNADDFRSMVTRDRKHTSVAIWSFANEIEAHQDTADNVTQKLFQAAANEPDHLALRPTSYNWVPVSSPQLDTVVNVHGVSHSNADYYEKYHAQYPDKPVPCCY